MLFKKRVLRSVVMDGTKSAKTRCFAAIGRVRARARKSSASSTPNLRYLRAKSPAYPRSTYLFFFPDAQEARRAILPAAY